MNKKVIRSWLMYDWANSAFATVIMAAILPVFYYDVAAKGSESIASSLWGYSQAIAVLFVALLSPILGAIADYSGNKSKFLRFFAYLGIIASIFLCFVDEGDYQLASILMILGTIGYAGGNVFYDALLPEIASKKEMDFISAKGFAYGYIGGGLLLAINLLMIMKPQLFNIPNPLMAIQISFIMVGIWWFIFSIPIFRNIKDNGMKEQQKNRTYIKIGVRRLIQTIKEIHCYKQLFIFLIAFWLYNDGISTIIKMATIYGRDIGIDSTDLIKALLITQFVGVPFTFLFGWLANKIKPKKALYISLWTYVGIVLLGFFMQSALHFYLLAITVGIVQGGAQALSRSIFGSMVPENRRAEFFGLYGVSAKFSAIIGPLIFALVGQLTGSSRFGIVSLVFFFLAGIYLLTKVNIEKGQNDANI
ncbi:MFS transporter [Bacillus sp. Marseille-P3661]|uniref:MFS transporter n=1 Tax=Bacillus sp. Marseille-P3661 TaxID=1936234 RepID=UPI000C861C9A|nr:MFS transporter [Bacillus sp. Marseille-P3661]